MGHDEMLQVLKEKMRLEGQLESLSSEANQVAYCFSYLCFCPTCIEHPLLTITCLVKLYKTFKIRLIYSCNLTILKKKN